MAGSSLVNGCPHQWHTVALAMTFAETFRQSAPYPRCAALGRPGGSVFLRLVAITWHGGQR